MISSWERKKFGDCAILVKNIVHPNQHSTAIYVGLEHIGVGTLSLIGQGDSKIVDSSKYQFKKGDILFGKLRPYFRKIVIAPFDGVCSTDIWVVRANEGVSQEFLFYWMASQKFVDTATRGAEGTKMPRAKWDFVAQIEENIPPLPEQEAIASVLSNLDEKVSFNQHENDILGAIADGIFRSWFIDFDPVRAKAEGKQPFGMDEETAALFPSEFEDSELGDIPKGWKIASVSEMADLNAYSLGKNDPLDYLEYIEISEVRQGEISNIQTFRRGEEPSRARRRLRHGDTVISTVRPDRGSFFLSLNPSEHLIASTGFTVVSPKNFPWSFVYEVLTQQSTFEYFGQQADGGAYPAIRPEVIGGIQVVVPDRTEIIEHYHKIVSPFLELADCNRKQSRTLAMTRDALLPKLLSGELRVADNDLSNLKADPDVSAPTE